jgi:murein DD-endopeptidase MepM/ murein hydrolase activator NlpD
MHPLALALIAALPLLPGPNWPNPTGDGTHQLAVTRVFDLPNGEYQAGHRGVDVRARAGAAMTAPAAGVVQFEGDVVGRGVLTLRVNERILLSFEPIDASVIEGEAIAVGEVLGIVEGSTHCGASCLHIGVRVDGHYVNPLRFFAGGRPRLLPMTASGETPD